MSRKVSKEASKLADRIVRLEGVTIAVLKLAIYRLKVKTGLCIHDTCPRPAVDGGVRCEKHRQLANERARRRYDAIRVPPEEYENDEDA